MIPPADSVRSYRPGDWFGIVGERALVHLKDLRPRYLGQRSKETGIVPY